ncbi:Riboflavin kinase [Aphelenchoides bicaudatus]|nr:Riboflavin kinase [Aphelenchoides bicaudatus]
MVLSLLNQGQLTISRPLWLLLLIIISCIIQVLFMDIKDSKENVEEPNTNGMLPYAFRGVVVHGFGRGGKKLNCPTANLDKSAVEALPSNFKNGIYGGVARVDNGSFSPMVMSVGYNVQFDNKIKTIEPHILKSFDKDFYGSTLEGIAFQYIRPMRAFSSLKELIEAIEKDKNDSLDYLRENEKAIRTYIAEKDGHNFDFN